MNIQYNTAKLAKEKGFDWQTLSFYDLEDKRLMNDRIGSLGGHDCCSTNPLYHYEIEDILAAPTQSELQTWLREVHKIQIEIEAAWNREMTEIIGYYYFNYKTWSEKVEIVFKEIEHFDTYEQALEVALLESLKLI